jgi:hypothetical protein
MFFCYVLISSRGRKGRGLGNVWKGILRTRKEGEREGGKVTSNVVSGKRRLGGGQAKMREGLESGRVEYWTSLKVQTQLRAFPVIVRYNSVLVH